MSNMNDQYINKQIRLVGNNIIDYEKRKEIERVLKKSKTFKEACLKLHLSRSTLTHERQRMGSTKIPYNADVAQKDFEEKQKRVFTKDQNNALRKEMNFLYKKLSDALSLSNLNQLKKEIRESLNLLIASGVNTEAFKRPLTLEDKRKIFELHHEGKNLKQIAMAVGRSRSSIDHILRRNKNFQSLQEDYREEIFNKWTS